MSEDRRTTEELLFELEQVKRADEDHFQTLLDDMEKIQAERDRLKAENAKLHATHDGHGTAGTPRGRAASPSATAVRDGASGSTKHEPEHAASHKQPLGRLTEGASTHKGRDPANEKVIAERRLRELAASGFRKRARSPECNQRARDPTPPRKERRRTSRSRSQTRSRDRQRPRSRGRDIEHSRDRLRQPRGRSDRDRSREHGQRVDQGRRRYSRSPQSPQRQSERTSPQPSQSPPWQRGRDVLALPGPAQAQSSSAMTVLDPGFAEHLQSMVAPLAALGPALQGIVSMLQAVPAAISGLKMEMSKRDAQNQQELQHITKQNQGLQDELSKVNAKIKTGSEIIDKNSMDVDKLKDDLEAERTAAAERARKAEASSRALREQQVQAGAALASVRKHMQDMPSKSAVDPRKIKEELTRLRKQVELLEAERQQPAASSAPAAAMQRQPDETGQHRSTADVPAPSAGQEQHPGSDHRQSIPGFHRNVRKQHLPPVEPEGLADFAASVWGPGNTSVKPALPPWLQQALEHISCKPATAGAAWPSRPVGIMQADVARAVSAALQHTPPMPAGSLQLNRQHPGLMPGVRPAGLAPGQPAHASSAPIRPTVPSHASAAQSQKQQRGSSWPPKGQGPVRGAPGPALSQGAPPWVQEAQRVSDMLTAQVYSDRWQPTQASPVPQRPSQFALPAPQPVAPLPAPTAPATFAGPSVGPGVPVPQSRRYISESALCSQPAPSSSQARQHPSHQGSPARPALLASAATESPSRPVASMAVSSKLHSDSLQQPSAAAGLGKASESVAQGSPAVASVSLAARHAQTASQQSPALSGAPSSQGVALVKQSAALAGASMSQAHARVPTADKLVQQMPASQQNAAILTGSAARQNSLGTGPEGARGTDGRRVESESKNQRRKRQRMEAQQAADAAPAPRSQQTPEAQSKRAKSHHEQATAQQVLAAPKVHAMPPLNADFICGICERAYSNSAGLHLHLIGKEHRLKLSHPQSRQGKAGEEGGSPETVAFRRSFPWSCKLCGRDFARMRQLVDHSSNSDKHTQLLQTALRKDRDEAREDGEVAGFAPILAGQALREAWAKQNSSPADNARQEALESPSRLRVVVLDDSTAPSGSQSVLVDQQAGQAARVDGDGGATEGWQYELPQHAADREGSRHQSREGSVEDGELPRVPVHFSLAVSKPVTPQTVPSAQPGAQPTATAAQKPSPAPSDRAIQASIASSAPHGPGAPAQQNAAAVKKDTFLPPHLKGLVSPNLKAPMPPQSGPPQPTASAGIAASKAAEKAMLQPQKQQSRAGHEARAPAAAPKASGLAKQPPNMPASTAMPQAAAPHRVRASGLQPPIPTAASTVRSSAATASSPVRARPASGAERASGATGAPAVMHRAATDQGRRASAVAASQLRTTPAAVSREPGTSAGGKGSAGAGRAVVAAPPMAASKGQPTHSAEAAPVDQKPTVRPAAAKVIQTGGAAPPVSAAASAAPPTSVPLPAEAIAAAASFLNDLDNANSSPSEALRSAPSGSRQPAAGHPGSKSRSAQQTQPAQSLPKLPANPPSPEMRLELLMQELSNMAHRLPDATPAEPPQKSAGPSVAASRAAAPSTSSLHQAVSRSASPASGMPLRVSAPPWQPQQVGRATAARSIAVRQGRGSSDADVTAAEKLRKEIAELHRVIDLKVREAKRKGTAGKAVPQGQKQPAQPSQAAPGSAASIIAKAKAEVPKASEQPSKGPSPAPNFTSKQTPRSSAPVPSSLVVQGEQNAPAQSSRAAEPTSKLALAGHSTGKQTPQAEEAAPAPSPLAAQGKQSRVAAGQRAAERTSTPASEASTGEAMTQPAKTSVVAPQKQHSCTSDRAKLAPKQPVASSVSNAARAEGTQLPSSRPSALGPVPATHSAAPASGPQAHSSQPSAAPVAEHPAAKQAVQEPQQVERPQMPSLSAPPPLKQADISGAGVPRMHASARPPMAHGQGGPAAASQRSLKAPAVPASPHGPTQPSVTPASAGKESVQLAAYMDRAERPAISQPSASAATATRAAPSQAQPVMPDVTPARDNPQERALWPTGDTQPCQPDIHTKLGKAGAMSAAATPPAGGSIRNGTNERPALSAQPVAKQREHASSTTLEARPGREAPHRLDSAAAAPLQAGKGTPLPVLALEDNTWTNSPSSSGTPAYTMLTQTPLGTGSPWPAAAQNKANSQPAPVLTQQRETPHLTPTPDRRSELTNGRAAAGAGERSVLGSFKAGQRADAAGQTPRATSPYSRTPPSGHRAARGRVMTTGRRPVQATPKKPSPPGIVAGDKAANIDGGVVSGRGKSRFSAGAASEPSGAQAGSSARHQTTLGSSAGFLERSGGRAGHMRSYLGTSSQSGRSLGSAHVAKADGREGINTTGSGKVAGVSTDIGRSSAVTGGEQVSRERQQASGTAAPPVSRAQAGGRLGTGIQEYQDTPAELEDMDIDIMTFSQGNSAGHLLKPGRSAPSVKAEKKHLQGTAGLAAAGPGSTQRGSRSPVSRQTSPVAAAQSVASHKAVSAPAASPATGTAPPQPALDVGIRAPLSAAERASPGGAAQPRQHSPTVPQSAGQGTGSSATAKAAPASASMSKPAAAKPAALPPQPQNPESRAHRAVDPPARAAPLTVQELVVTGEATQAESASAKTAAATAQHKASEGLVPKAVQSPPKLAAPSLQQKKPLDALPKPGVAPQHKTAEATSSRGLQAPVTSKSQGQQDESALKTLPKPAQAPARAAAAAPSNSAAPPPPAKEKAPAGIKKPAPAVKNPAGPASLAKASSPSKLRIPAPKQAPPASSAQAVQAPAKYTFLYPQKEDSTAANSQKLSRFAVANRSAASAPKPAPLAQKVHTSRMVAAGSPAGGAHRPQHSAGQGPAQGQSSKRIVTISHDSRAGNGMAAQNLGPDFEAAEPGEMRMPLQMPPMPVHMRPLQDPSQGAPFSQERTEDPRYLPRQGPPMEWFHPESMSMASLPQPWHMHERQMSGHRGHAVELQAQQRFGAPEGRLPRGEEERQQGMQSMHLPPQLPPLPMHMPPGKPAYNSQGHFTQQFLSDEGMGRSEHYGVGPGLPPGLGGPDFGRPYSQGFGMYGTPEQLPFPPQ